MLKNTPALAFALATAFACGAQAQERTEASAHSFLFDAFSRNVTVNHYYTGASYSGSGCLGSVGYASPNGGHRLSIDYSKLSSVATNYISGGMVINVPVTDHTGYSSSSLYVSFGSDELRDRVSAALIFLRDKCDASRSTGF